MQMAQTTGSNNYIFFLRISEVNLVDVNFWLTKGGSKYEDIAPVDTSNQPPLAKVTLVKKSLSSGTSLCSHITMWVRKYTWDIAMFAAILSPGIRDVCTYSQ